MPWFRVRVHEPPAAPAWREVEAADEAALPLALGLAPTRLLEVHSLEGAARRGLTFLPGAGARRRQRIDARLFAQELAVLLDSGVPLLEALQTLAERNAGAAEPLSRVQAQLSEGRTL
jgi:general secretion pathway protein F